MPQIWIRPFQNKTFFQAFRFDFDPQTGYEGGTNIHNPLAELNGRRISRFKTEGFAKLTFFTNKTLPLSAVALQASYVYRYLFEPELISSPTTVDFGIGQLFPDDGSGAVRFPGASVEVQGTKRFDTGPRRYADVSLRFILNKNWEFYTSFTRGELPPAYKHVDKIQTGVAFRFKIGTE